MTQLTVGLDIGTSAVRAAELDVSHSSPVLHTYGQVGLPPGSLVDGEIRDVSSVTEAIIKLWKNGQFSSKSVIVGIAGLRAITREIDLPFVPDNEIDSAVRFQSEEVIPFPPEQTILSSQILADYTSPEGDKMRRVLVAAAHVDLVNGVIEAVEKAGLTVEGVDLISSALVRAVGGQDASEQPEAIVSVGAGLTVVVVHQQGRPQFVRTIGSGGNATTAAVSSALDLPISDAEGLKRRIGEPAAQQMAAERAAQASMNELVGEIRNSIQYFASLPGRLPVSRLLVTGGGSELSGLIAMLEAQVRLPVLTVSPLTRLDTSRLDLGEEQARQVGSVLATPIGLALPEPDKAVKKFNLIPPEVAQRARMKRIQERTLLVGAAVLVLLVLFGAWKFYQVHNAQNNVEAAPGEHRQPSTPRYPSTTWWSLRIRPTQPASPGAPQCSTRPWIGRPLLSELFRITPASAEVQALSGSEADGASASSTGCERRRPPLPATAASAGSAATPSSTTSAAIGTIQFGVTGPGPSLSISEAWINAIAGSSYFANPLQGATVVNPDSTISFPFSVSVTPAASLSKNASLK